MKISILVTSDVHGYLCASDGVSESEQLYGLSRFSTYVKEKRKENENTVLIENGDFLEGSPLAAYLYMNRDSYRVNPLATILNDLDYDAAVPGNHEFDFGLDYVTEYTKALKFSYLAANIIDVNTESTYWKPYTIVQKNGVKIGIIGLVTEHVPRLGYGRDLELLQFMDPVQTALYWTEKIREKVDVLLLSYHGGTERDLSTGKPTEYQTGENVGYKLATEVPGIDGIITGHQHKVFSSYINNIPILQPGTRGSHVGEINFTLQKGKQQKWEISNSESNLIAMKDFPEDEHFLTKITNLLEETDQWMQTPIHQLPTFKNGKQDIVSILHQIQQTVTNESISAVSLFQGTQLNKNQIDLQQIVDNYTFPNTMAVLRMNGQELADILTSSAKFFQVNDEGQLTPFAKEQTNIVSEAYGNMWTGLTYKLIPSQKGEFELEYLRTSSGSVINKDSIVTLVCNHTEMIRADLPLFYKRMIIHEIMIYLPDLLAKYVRDKHVILPVQTLQYKQVNFK